MRRLDNRYAITGTAFVRAILLACEVALVGMGPALCGARGWRGGFAFGGNHDPPKSQNGATVGRRVDLRLPTQVELGLTLTSVAKQRPWSAIEPGRRYRWIRAKGLCRFPAPSRLLLGSTTVSAIPQRPRALCRHWRRRIQKACSVFSDRQSWASLDTSRREAQGSMPPGLDDPSPLRKTKLSLPCLRDFSEYLSDAGILGDVTTLFLKFASRAPEPSTTSVWPLVCLARLRFSVLVFWLGNCSRGRERQVVEPSSKGRGAIAGDNRRSTLRQLAQQATWHQGEGDVDIGELATSAVNDLQILSRLVIKWPMPRHKRRFQGLTKNLLGI